MYFDDGLARFWAKLKEPIAKALIVALVAALFSFLADETQVDKALTQLAAKVFAPVAAYVNDFSVSESDRVSDRFVIVDIDAASARHAEEGWPFSYGHHARVLEQIRRQKPKALFVDIQFESDRADPSLPRLLESLCRYKADGIPVFMAAGSESLGGKLRPELEALRTSDQQPCFERVGVGYEVSSDQLVWTYPLKTELGDTTIRSAGLAMAEVMRGRPLQIEHRSQMGLTWTAGAPDNGPLWRAEGKDESQGEVHYCRESQVLDLTLLPQIVRGGAYELPYCPRHASVIVDWVTAPRSEAQRQEVFDALTNRVVLYGVSFDPNDHITSPLHGRIPGVYLHAQAADNLAQHGDAWRRPTLSWRWPSHFAEWGVKIFVMFVLALIVQWGVTWIQVLWPWSKKHADSTDSKGCGAGAESIGHCAKGAQSKNPDDSFSKTFVRHLVDEFLSSGEKLGKFWLGLVLAFILIMGVEAVLHVSVIGYASLLGFVLVGDVFTSPDEHKKS